MQEDTIVPSLLYELATALSQNEAKLVTAESCTGGGIAYQLTSVAGSSQWFERGFVTYSDQSKIELLDVNLSTLETKGAVSEEVVREMAEGALKKSYSNFSVAVTGIAGPSGGSQKKPVGTCWFGWASHFFNTKSQHRVFAGDRTKIRSQAISFALEEVLALIKTTFNK